MPSTTKKNPVYVDRVSLTRREPLGELPATPPRLGQTSHVIEGLVGEAVGGRRLGGQRLGGGAA
jgi:hypothetical protein